MSNQKRNSVLQRPAEVGRGVDVYLRKSKCIRCNTSDDSFQNATLWMLATSQFFGIIPLIGVVRFTRKSNRQQPSFVWNSPNTLYTLFLLAVSAVETGLCLLQIFESGFFFGNIGALTFYLLAVISRSLCIILARQWSEILQLWRRTELIFLELPYISPIDANRRRRRRFSLASRAKVTFIFFISLTLGEFLVCSHSQCHSY